MIYLTRTTSVDGTHTTEIAALEGPGRLQEYAAAGWRVVPYEEYREGWRRKSMRLREQVFPPALPDGPASIPAPCHPALAFRQKDGTYKCSACKGHVQAPS